MVRPIVKDMFFLRQKSQPATADDLPIARDLLDTLKYNRAGCVGLAANMIGVKKCIIAVSLGFMDVAMLNPVITAQSGVYETEEGCLSLPGVRPCRRCKKITVEYFDLNFAKRVQTFEGFPAQIIQHEIDHCNGILI